MKKFGFGVLALLLSAASLQAQCTSSSYRSRSYNYYPSASYSTYSYAPYVAQSYSPPAKVYEAPAYVKEYEVVKYLVALPLVALPSYAAAYMPPPTNGNGANGPGVQPGNGSGGPTPAAQANPQMLQITQQLEALNKGMVELSKGVSQLNERVGRLEQRERSFQAPKEKEKEKLPPPAPGPKDKDDEPASGQQDVVKAAEAVNKQYCAVCHQRGSDKDGKDIPETYGGGFVLSSESGRILNLSADQREELQRQLLKDKMPLVGKDRAKEHGIKEKLTEAQKKAFFNLIDQQIALGKRKQQAKVQATGLN